MSYSIALKMFDARCIYDACGHRFLVAALYGTLALGASSAQAQGATTDIVTVNIGHTSTDSLGTYSDGFSKDLPLGAVSPAMASTGYQYNQVQSKHFCFFFPVMDMCYPYFYFSIVASTDPGKSFLTSISNATATLQGSAASYSYDQTSQIATWTFFGTADPFAFHNASSEQLTIIHD